MEYEVNTFLNAKKKLDAIVLGVLFEGDLTLPLLDLVDDEFDINLEIDNFQKVKNILTKLN